MLLLYFNCNLLSIFIVVSVWVIYWYHSQTHHIPSAPITGYS